MPVDPYTTLGVNKSASADEIKKAYRKLAHQYHPDKKGGNEAKFKEVNEAYQTLSDPDKKARYDQFGHAGAQGGFGGGGFGGGQYQDFDFSQFGGAGGGFESIFNMFTGGSARPSRPEKGEDLHLRVQLDKKDLGQKRVYEFEAFDACTTCSGTGAKDGKLETCATCKGQGHVRQAVRTPFGTFAQVVACDSCNGEGQVAAHTCAQCQGVGRIKTKRTVELHIPKTISNHYLVAFPQQGNAGLKGTPAGDLLITLQVS